MFVVDTNILVYGVNRRAPGHAQCRDLILQWRSQVSPWYLTWGIVYEFLRVTTHPKVLREPLSFAAAWRYLDALLMSRSLEVLTETERHRVAAEEVFAETHGLSSNHVFDAHIAILMKEHGIRMIYTHDAHFSRFGFLQVIDPLSGL